MITKFKIFESIQDSNLYTKINDILSKKVRPNDSVLSED